MGLVVYIGRTHLGAGTYIGVEVTDTTAGQHDGMVRGLADTPGLAPKAAA